MPRKIVLKSPAKVNLFLKVLGKRPDGYHRIETVFERIALCDRIVLRKRKSGIEVKADTKDLPAGGDNLAYKAAALLFEKTGSPGGVAIEIRKSIPISAGLGGGSSNAAAVLLGLNKLYDFGLGLDGLLEPARKLGADVAFFVHNCPFAKGAWRGDVVTPVKTRLRLWHVLVMPPFGLSTKDVYESLEHYPTEEGPDLETMLNTLGDGDLTGLSGLSYNSLEKVALARHPEIGRVKEELINLGALAALVSGSGPAVFGLTKTGRGAMRIKIGLKKGMLRKKKDWRVYTVRTM